MTVIVRRVRPEEYAAAGQVSLTGYQADDLLRRPDGSQDRAYAERLSDVATRDASAEVFVAVESGEVLGTVTWCPPRSQWRELADRDDQAEFRMLSVDPRGRGRGVGGALVQFCVDRARSAGMSEVVLSSLPEMTSAHRLYQAFGFVRAPELDHTPVPGVDLWAFRLTQLR